ncbi:trans-sialidase [Trypanosoma conorhini]|uniref:Trans-sialidase n=1 Tax=Trypanosoma conorhini TaxID=83891 RepID=A0A422PGS6_9TRYP|nr:trans-sialidase [Trypanosoma conorhini]RNF16916.1 trans-sialidase [Trypanosoma conorhini]
MPRHRLSSAVLLLLLCVVVCCGSAAAKAPERGRRRSLFELDELWPTETEAAPTEGRKKRKVIELFQRWRTEIPYVANGTEQKVLTKDFSAPCVVDVNGVLVALAEASFVPSSKLKQVSVVTRFIGAKTEEEKKRIWEQDGRYWGTQIAVNRTEGSWPVPLSPTAIAKGDKIFLLVQNPNEELAEDELLGEIGSDDTSGELEPNADLADALEPVSEGENGSGLEDPAGGLGSEDTVGGFDWGSEDLLGGFGWDPLLVVGEVKRKTTTGSGETVEITWQEPVSLKEKLGKSPRQFLGGTGAAIVTSDDQVVFPVKAMTADWGVVSLVIHSKDPSTQDWTIPKGTTAEGCTDPCRRGVGGEAPPDHPLRGWGAQGVRVQRHGGDVDGVARDALTGVGQHPSPHGGRRARRIHHCGDWWEEGDALYAPDAFPWKREVWPRSSPPLGV